MKTHQTILLAAAFLLTGCEKARFDQQVKELCAKDGGVKVYETVKMPAEKVNQWGQINFFKPTQGENALGPGYIYKVDKTFIKQGKPHELAMWRDHIQIIRRSDGKLLGESVSYSRRGGDLPGPWHPTSLTCPAIDRDGLESSIFITGENK